MFPNFKHGGRQSYFTRKRAVTLDYFPKFLEADVRKCVAVNLVFEVTELTARKNKKASNFEVKLICFELNRLEDFF